MFNVHPLSLYFYSKTDKVNHIGSILKKSGKQRAVGPLLLIRLSSGVISRAADPFFCSCDGFGSFSLKSVFFQVGFRINFLLVRSDLDPMMGIHPDGRI